MKKLILSIFLVISLAITSFAAEPFFTDVIVTSPNGIWTDARAYSTLNDAVAAVGANERTIVIASPQIVTTLTVPSTSTLRFERNGSITNSGYLNIQTKNIIADNRQIFTGVGNIDFVAGSIVKTGWFSNIESAFALTTNDTVTLEVSKPATVTANYSPNSNINLKWTSPGNILTVTAGTTLSNLKNIEAGNFQIFGTTGDVDFVAGAVAKTGWFANIESAFNLTSDDTITLVVTNPQTIATSTSLGNNVNLKWESPGNILTLGAGVVVGNLLNIEAGNYQLFAGTGDFDFLDGSRLKLAWFASLQAALAWVENEEVTIVVTGSNQVSTDETSTVNEYFDFISGQGQFLVDIGHTLTIYSPANIKAAPSQQIFTGAGTVAFSGAGGSSIYPNWWGAATSASAATNAAALQSALTALSASASILYVPEGTYEFNVELSKTIATERITIKGAGFHSILKWTGADEARMLDFTGAGGSGHGLEISDLCLDANSKASTCVRIALASEIVFSRMLFTSTKLDGAATGAAIDVLPGCYNGVIEKSWFWNLYSKGITINSAGASSGPVGWTIRNNSFAPVHNLCLYGKNLTGINFSNNLINTSGRADTAAAGVDLDVVAQAYITGNYFESVYGIPVRLNNTAGRTTPGITGKVEGNTFNNCGVLSTNFQIEAGFTESLSVVNNDMYSVGGGSSFLNITANAVGTRIGRNLLLNDAGVEQWEAQATTDNGVGTYYNYSVIPFISTTAILTLTNQSSFVAFTGSPAISATVSGVPVTARGWIVQASIKSATAGARLYLTETGNIPSWSNRNSDKRIQFVEAQVAGRYNTQEFTVKASHLNKDSFVYAIAEAGVTDTDIEFRIVGWLGIE